MSADPTLHDLQLALAQANARLARLLTATTTTPPLLHPFLDLIDALDAALAAGVPGSAAAGLRTALRQAEAALVPFGLEPIAAEGAFDASQHQAVLVRPAPSPEQAHTIAAVHKRGWRQLADPPRVLRYAEVTVYGEPAS